MKILLVHEFYRQPGGEDTVFEAEAALLERAGHAVVRYTEHNSRIEEMSKAELAVATLWNASIGSELADLVGRERPDVAHFHNTFPLISPAAYYAVRRSGVPIVQTLHNFRLLCLNGLFLRRGTPCRECLGRLPWRGVVHACYHSSRAESAGVAVLLGSHRLLGTWRRAVDAFIVLTEFARQQFVAGGLPDARLHIKPNFLLDDPGCGDGGEGFALFAGRLSPEKGVEVLLEAWKLLGDGAPRLVVVGGGPLASLVREHAAQSSFIRYAGPQDRLELLRLMQQAGVLVLPSLWFEGLPMVAIEALSTGLPVIASRLGGLPELITENRTGWLTPPGDAEALASRVRSVLSGSRTLAATRDAARREFEKKYTASRNLDCLLDVYRAARAYRMNRSPGPDRSD